MHYHYLVFSYSTLIFIPELSSLMLQVREPQCLMISLSLSNRSSQYWYNSCSYNVDISYLKCIHTVSSALPNTNSICSLTLLYRYVCISGVFILTTECPSLVVTLIITLRKFVSLLFSILYFKNPFTSLHWIGTMLVFGGTLLFTGLIQTVINHIQNRTKDKQE